MKSKTKKQFRSKASQVIEKSAYNMGRDSESITNDLFFSLKMPVLISEKSFSFKLVGLFSFT